LSAYTTRAQSVRHVLGAGALPRPGVTGEPPDVAEVVGDGVSAVPLQGEVVAELLDPERVSVVRSTGATRLVRPVFVPELRSRYASSRAIT